MIVYVDLEHPRVLGDPLRGPRTREKRQAARALFEALSGQPCLLQHHTEVSAETLRQAGVEAIVLSGNSTDWDEYEPGAFREVERLVREEGLPVLGLCGGHQLIAMAHGVPCGPIRMVQPGEAIPEEANHRGLFKEVGFQEVRILRPDPLFEGLRDRCLVFESHYWEVKEPPEGFDLLASNRACRVQAMRARHRLVYGVQFHPEWADDAHADGRRILENFFRLSGLGHP